LDKIHLLLGNFRSYKIYHVLRELNERVDVEANKGTLLAPGNLKVNGTLSRMALPWTMRAALLIQKKQVGAAERENGEITQFKSCQNKLLGGGDKARYHEKASIRQGRDRESTRPYLTDLANRMEIMSMEEGGNKLKAPPQSQPIPVQRSLEYYTVKQQGARRSGRWLEMESSSDNKPSTEERLKAVASIPVGFPRKLGFWSRKAYGEAGRGHHHNQN